jgi:hypothetical protein
MELFSFFGVEFGAKIPDHTIISREETMYSDHHCLGD